MKKKILSFLLVLIAILAQTSVSVAAEDTAISGGKYEYVMGDANLDGIVDSTDYLQIKKTFLGEFSLKGTAYAMADVNYDGIINVTDYLKIKAVLLELSEFDESVWEHDAKQPSVNYKTEGVGCANVLYGTYDRSYCKGAICGDPTCDEEASTYSTDQRIPVGPGIRHGLVEDSEEYRTPCVSKFSDKFLYNGEIDLLRNNDETAEKTISVTFEGVGAFDLEYQYTMDSIFVRWHIYSLSDPTDEISYLDAYINASTGEVFMKKILYTGSPVDAPYSKEETLSKAKTFLRNLLSDKNNTFFRGMRVNSLEYREKHNGDYIEYCFPVMVNGYKTDVEVCIIVFKNEDKCEWRFGHCKAYQPVYIWLFGVDKRSIDIDDNFETYKDSITGYERFVHNVQTRELRCNDFKVTLTSHGTIGAALDCATYNMYTGEWEYLPYADQTLVLGVPLKKYNNSVATN